jgi:hypothetical protein
MSTGQILRAESQKGTFREHGSFRGSCASGEFLASDVRKVFAGRTVFEIEFVQPAQQKLARTVGNHSHWTPPVSPEKAHQAQDKIHIAAVQRAGRKIPAGFRTIPCPTPVENTMPRTPV